MEPQIIVTKVHKHSGGTLIFSGVVNQGQVLNNGWSKLDSGKVVEIRGLDNEHALKPIADTFSECMFVCSNVHTRVTQGDVLRLNN